MVDVSELGLGSSLVKQGYLHYGANREKVVRYAHLVNKLVGMGYDKYLSNEAAVVSDLNTEAALAYIAQKR